MDLTQERLRELLHYNPLTGVFVWRKLRGGPSKVGNEAGCVMSNGYVRITVEGRSYAAHQLAWLYMTGEWAIGEIDHRNLRRADNSWGNLRPATTSQNRANTPKRRNNTSGFKGVTFHSGTGKWRAIIRKEGRRFSLGLFHSPEDAAAAYAHKATELFGDFARAA